MRVRLTRLARVLLTRVCCSALVALTWPGANACAQRATSPAVGWLFSWTITPTSEGRAMKGGSLLLDVAIWQGTARITVRQGPLRALTGDSGVLLLRSADSTLLVVNPARREVLKAAAGDLGSLMGGPPGGAPIEIADARSTTRSTGAGPRVFGYATRHAVLTQQYTLQVNAPGVRRAVHTEQVHDLDLSRDIARLDPAFRTFAAQFAGSLGLPPLVRAKLRALERAMPDGIPVIETTTAVTVSGSDTLRTTTRAEMTGLRREPVDTSSFMVPAGYRVTDMNRLLQRRSP